MKMDEIKKDIYCLLKDSKAKSNFEKVEKISRKKLTYKYDKNISISLLHKNKTKYSYDYFFTKDKVLKENLSDFEKFIVKVCEIDSSLSCTDDITQQEWCIEYNNLPIYRCNLLNIINLSSIDFVIPERSLDIFDFEHNLLEIINENSYALFRYHAINIIQNELNIQESTFQNF